MNRKTVSTHSSRYQVSGLSLIELMIAMVLGLLVVGAVSGIFLSNRQAYRSTESLGRIQESARVAFELMARDVREAGSNPCSNEIPVANVLTSKDTDWWVRWQNGLRGYDDNEAAPGTVRKSGTDAIDLNLSSDSGIRVIVKMPVSSADIEVNKTDGLSNGEIVMICDHELAGIFQVTMLPSGLKVQHNTGSGSPGNCSKGFQIPVECSNADKSTWHKYDENAAIAKMSAIRWYVADNGRGGTSLYRSTLRNDTGAALSTTPEEITEGVRDMQLTYLEKDGTAYKVAGGIPDWQKVAAVRIRIVLEGLDRVGTDGKVLDRTIEHVATLRSRMP